VTPGLATRAPSFGRVRRSLAVATLASAVAGAGLARAQQPQAQPVVTSLTLFAGTGSGLWRSRNWGADWERARPGAVHAILALGPRVYAGGDEGVLLSEDFGQTWKAIDVGSTVLAVLPSRYPQADPTVFAGTAGGLLKSADGGTTFKATALGTAPVMRLEWPGPALVVATAQGVRVSVDAAGTFGEGGQGLPAGDVRALALSSFFAVDPVLFAAVSGQGVFRSSDGGRTWAAAGLAGRAVNDLVWLGPFLYAASEDGLFRSEDTGRTWTPLGEGLRGRAVTRLLFPLAPASGSEIFAGTDQGVYRSADGGLRWLRAGTIEERVFSLGTFPPPSPVSGKRRRR
jgi:photosystem II stability/assembly factor-like uncharacterized protein